MGNTQQHDVSINWYRRPKRGGVAKFVFKLVIPGQHIPRAGHRRQMSQPDGYCAGHRARCEIIPESHPFLGFADGGVEGRGMLVDIGQ